MGKMLAVVINVYQVTLSPLLVAVFGKGCRFYPTCSEYTIQLVQQKGLNGLIPAIKRFSKCHGLYHGLSYDPPKFS